jgi:hypothetical protein
MTNLTPAVGWDLDSTLAGTMHRQPFIDKIRAGAGTWEDYSLMCADDEPVEGAIALMQLMRVYTPELLHIVISGRSQCALGLTWSWLRINRAVPDLIRLRPDGDNTPNGEWKVSQIRALAEERGFEIVLFVEDHPGTAAYIREHAGIPVLGVNPFYEMPSPDPSRNL